MLVHVMMMALVHDRTVKIGKKSIFIVQLLKSLFDLVCVCVWVFL